MSDTSAPSGVNKLCFAVWRWHFYAGLFVVPFIVILAVSGAVYLFKPQIEHWEENAFRGLSSATNVSANIQLDAALKNLSGESI